MMDLTDLQQKTAALTGTVELRFWEELAKHTSLRIGGGAEIMAFPKDTQELAGVLRAAAQLRAPLRILGAGTNVLAPDEGLEGITVCLKDCLTGLERREGNLLRCAAGVTMSRAAAFAAGEGLSGLEFAHGIPGTVGGGVYMNAGAYGGEMKDVCLRAQVMDRKGNLTELSREELGFSYRHSALEDGEQILIWAEFGLTPGDPEEIWKKMKELIARRSASQPLNLPSAGSAFKRPVGGYAAALIDQAGLRGFRVGDAAISEKHAGFAVNLGRATAADVRGLLEAVKDQVWEKSGILLEPEIRIW